MRHFPTFKHKFHILWPTSWANKLQSRKKIFSRVAHNYLCGVSVPVWVMQSNQNRESVGHLKTKLLRNAPLVCARLHAFTWRSWSQFSLSLSLRNISNDTHFTRLENRPMRLLLYLHSILTPFFPMFFNVFHALIYTYIATWTVYCFSHIVVMTVRHRRLLAMVNSRICPSVNKTSQ